MMQLYWCPRSRSFSALWLMEEVGQPYERALIDITTGAQKTSEFLAINPMGKVPALKDGDATVAEASAICAYVAERYPEAKLAPPVGDPRRAKYLQWLFFSPGCIEPAMIEIFTQRADLHRRVGQRGPGVRRAGCRARKGTVSARRHVHSRGHHDRLGTEFRDAAVQDGARTSVIRPLYRRLLGAPRIPARDRTCGGMTISHTTSSS